MYSCGNLPVIPTLMVRATLLTGLKFICRFHRPVGAFGSQFVCKYIQIRTFLQSLVSTVESQTHRLLHLNHGRTRWK